MKVASVVATVLLLCIAFPGSIHAKKYCVGKDGKHYLRGEHYEDKKGEKCIRYTCVRKGKKLEMNKKKISCDEPPPDVMANVTALEASVKSLQTSVESILEMVTALQFRSSQLETNVTTNIDAISTNVATLATKCDASTCSSLQTTATDIESCLADITSSTCPPPPSGKTGVAGGISGNTAALADKCDASTCKDIQTTVENLERNVTTNKDTININKDDISTNVASLATKCDASSCTSLQTSATDIESCLADITSSACPPPSNGKTSMAGGISGNTAALADKCDASTCSDIQTTVENLETNVKTNKATININKDDISTNVASLATKCDASSCTSLQTSATDIESCLADITSSACPSPPSGKTSVAEGIANNTAALDHKCDASTCKDIENMVLNLGSSTETTTTTMTTTTTTKAQTVLWIAKNDKTLETLKLPDFTPVNASCKVPNPNMDLSYSNIQEIQGKLYSCDHRLCQTYSAEDNTWKTIPGKRFKFQRRHAAGTVVGDKWIVQGGWVLENGKTIDVKTAEVWSPGTGNWVEAPQYKSPLPVSGHCVVNINGMIMQIGGWSNALPARTGKCFVDGGEVASLKAPRSYHSCAVFHGEVWVAGGGGWLHPSRDARVVEIYNPQSKSWAEGAKLPGEIKPDPNPLLVTSEGNLYYVGGNAISKIYKLNIDQSKWEEVGDIAKGRKWGHIVNTKVC